MSVSALYDANFCFPVKELESTAVKLTPFIPSSHAERYFAHTHGHPDIYDNLPWGPFSSSAEFVNTVIDRRIQPSQGMILFAVLDKTESTSVEGVPAFAGVIGMLNTCPSNLSTEIGFLITFPPFRGTHVTSNAIGLLLQWCLDLPLEGGLGLRRVQWQTNELNIASARVAEKMGFRLEGILRWQRVLPESRRGPARVWSDGTVDSKGPGRHTKMFSLCWDDWENGEKQRVKEILMR